MRSRFLVSDKSSLVLALFGRVEVCDMSLDPEVARVCSQLLAKGVTERRDASVALRKLLGRPSILRSLDENSDYKRKNALTWDQMFARVKEFVVLEMDYMIDQAGKKSEKSLSATALSTRKKRFEDAATLIKLVICSANARSLHLKGLDILNHILFVLDDPLRCKHVGYSYCNILLKCVLSVPTYRPEIPPLQWEELLERFVKIVEDPPAWSMPREQGLMIQVLHSLYTGSPHPPLNKTIHFKFFKNIFKDVRQGMNIPCIENLLDSLLSFAISVAEDCRGQLCLLGESIFADLLNLWRKQGLAFKEHLVPFFQLQMSIHHPCGTHTDDQGAWCANITHWKKCLQKLYEAMLLYIDNTGKRIRGPGAKLDPYLKPGFLDLAADLLHQVLWGPSSCHSVDLGRSSKETGSSTKKRRIDVGWYVVCEKLSNCPEGSVLLSWLQVLSTLFVKHPSCIPEKEVLAMLTTLHHIQATCKRPETTGNVLKCLEAFARCVSRGKLCRLNEKETIATKKDTMATTWHHVWTAALKTIGSKNHREFGFSLIATLIKEKVISPDVDAWKVLCSGPPSRASMDFLSVHIRLYPLPEGLKLLDSLLLTSNSAKWSRYPLRHHLFDWLLPVATEGDDTSRGIACLLHSKSNVCMGLVADILTSLTQRSPTMAHAPDASTMPKLSDNVAEFHSSLASLEHLYVKSSFDEGKGDTCVAVERFRDEKGTPDTTETSRLEPFCSLLMERLCNLHEQLSELFETEPLGATPKERLHTLGSRGLVMSRYCSLVCDVISLMAERNALPQEPLHSIPLVKRIGVFKKKIATYFNDVMNLHDCELNTRAESLVPIIEELHKSFDGPRTFEPLLAIMRSLTPARHLEDISLIYHGKWGQSSLNMTRMDVTEVELDRTADVTMEDDDGFDSTDSGAANDDSPPTSQETITASKSSIAVLREACGKFLCVFGSPEQRDNVVELFDTEDFQIKKQSDLQLYFSVSSCLAERSASIRETELGVLLDAFKRVMATHYKNPHICRQGLSLLRRLSPALREERHEEARKVAAFMIKVFWSLKVKDTSVRLELAKCMQVFIEVDPEGRWTTVTEKGETFSLRKEFSKMLTDSSHSVRMLVAETISCLFLQRPTCGKVVADNKPRQYSTFQQVEKVLAKSLIIPSHLSDGESEDEGVNRSSSMLAVLKSIAIASPVCEKRAVSLMFQASKEQFLDKELVIKVLTQLAHELGFLSLPSYVDSHLGFILHNWLNHGFQITDFLHGALGCTTTADFLRSRCSVVLPQLISRPGSMRTSIKLFTEQVNPGGDCTSFILESFCSIIACLVPWFAVQSRKEAEAVGDSQEMKRLKEARSGDASQGYEFLKEMITTQTVDKVLNKNFDEVVVQLLMRMYEPPDEGSDIATFSRESDPEPNPPFFTSYPIKATLEYMTRCYPGETVVSVLCKNKDNIQKILLALTTRIADSHLPYERRRVLSMYRLFVLLVIQELSNGLRNTWAFFIRDVIFSLRRIITSEELVRDRRSERTGLETEADMFSPCCNLMHYLCEAAIQCCSQELGSHLHIIVSTLMPYASGHDERATQALSLLRYLIVECTPSLLDAIPLLDPFPDLPQFKELNDAYLSVKSRRRGTFLAQEISQFVSVSPRSPPLSRLEGLRHLRHLLATNKLALYGLLRCDKACSSPTIVSDLIHELISLSAQLNSVHTSTATHIKVAIADCLGEIGPVDLASVALAGRQVQDPLLPSTELLQGDPIVCRNSTIIGLLNRYLTDKSVKVVHAASDCLKRVLATPSGINLLKMYEQHQAEKLLWYLEPFKPARKRKTPSAVSSDVEMAEDFMTVLGRDELWLPTRGGVGIDHATWITDLTSVIITSGAVKDEMLRLLAPVCKVKVEFAEQVLPFLVHNILEQEAANENEASRDLLSGQVGALFVHYNEASSAPDPNNRATKVSKKSIRTILKVTNHLRTQPRPKARGQGSSTPWDNNFWLDLDYLEAAKAAQKCTAHFTALMYTEIWCDVQRSLPENPMNITLPTRSQDIEVDSASQSTDGGLSTSYQSLLVDIYSSIAELDSVYGVGAGRLADLESRIRTYEHEELWEKAVGAYDLRMQESPTAQIGMLKALKNFGLYHVMDNYLRGIPPDSLRTSPEVAELQFESAWRNCTWDIDTSLGSDVSRRPGFHQSLHTCLSALGDGEESLFRITLENAKLRVVSEVSHVSLESARSIYPNMVRLQQLTELQQYTLFFTSCDTNELVNKWKERFPLPDNDFIFVEPVLALRTAALHMLARVNSRQGREVLGSIYQVLVGHLESQAKLARQAGKPQVAEKALFAIRHLHTDAQVVQSVGGHVPGAWRMEEARLRWSRGETETAMHLLKCLTKQLQASPDEEEIRLYPQALGLYGSWMAETRSENPNKIIEEYLEKATNLMESMEEESAASPIEAYLSLARYADTQYQNIVDYMKSSDFENKQEIARDAKSEYNRLSKVVARPERDKYIRTLMVESEIDEEELRLMEDSKMNFLQKALENYAKTLQAGDKYDLRVFRLCSLWFDNCKTSFVDDIMKDSISRIQSRKFLPLMYQLAARLGMRSSQDDAFQATLGQLIERTCVDHPHHTLLILIALVNADRDREYTAPSRRNGRDSRASRNASKETKGFIDEARLEAASALIESISHQRGQLVQMTKSLCLAYIELAYWEVGHLKGKTGPFDIKDTLAIKKMNNLRHVAVPTSDIKVDPLCRYEEIVYVDRFMPTFSLAGGVNLPKIIACVGSDGVKRRQLVKGRDDLRQDAVMEQVFGMVNQLLANNTETRKRKLRVRTYKVIPLSQRSGMLEWCEGTMPLGEYLIGSPGHNTGAHQRYNPRDWSPMDCRRKMASVDGSRKTKEGVFKEVMDHFKPVFRHFFLEKFVDPAEWFERRLAYTRSCATSSIVGYIVGLGDRHVQNILVDCNSAELVHIDLGVAFEQGKVLPTPETVPFRLTRDLVDGMGVTGVEGVFRRCCEKTMAVMRTSQEALVTILEVLLYDPLYSWTLSPEKKMALQATKPDNDVSEISSTAVDLVGDLPNGENTENGASVGNKMAERVLSRLKQKLNGIEDNTQLSVTGQVNHLIRQAMDVKNLCRLFPGWQPWV